ncbi:MAG: 1-acyl-sn-glycerol-3-phosphate acyltransferase [Desulfobacteraceae bacterium]|nr:1-acyl-sn-glycerol-3-phosphate acyltransferase [Desulfobacteraceae bacterium]
MTTYCMPNPGSFKHRILRAIAWFLTHLPYRVRCAGAERIPAQGGAVLVCNHVSYLDALFIYAASPRPMRFVMHTDYIHLPGLGWLFRLAGVIPIDSARKNPAVLNRALKEIDATLQAGGLIGIFPEGHLTKSGHVDRFRPGIEEIIRRNAVPVIPLALRGLWGSFFSHKGGPAMTHWPRRIWSRIELAVGDTVHPRLVTAEYLREKVRHLRGARA